MADHHCRVFMAGTDAEYHPDVYMADFAPNSRKGGDLLPDKVCNQALLLIQKTTQNLNERQLEKITDLLNKIINSDDGKMANDVTDLVRYLRAQGLEKKIQEAFEEAELLYPTSLHNQASPDEDRPHDIAYHGVRWYGGGINAFGATTIARMALEEIQQRYLKFEEESKSDPSARFKLDLGGWSRGGVTAYWVAKHLPSVLSKEQLEKVDVTINVKDPVPGNFHGLNATKYGARFANMVSDLSHCPWIKKIDITVATDSMGVKDSLFRRLAEKFYSTILPKVHNNTKINVAVEPAAHQCQSKVDLRMYYSEDYGPSATLIKKSPYGKSKRFGITGGSFGRVIDETSFNKAPPPFFNSKHYEILLEAKKQFPNGSEEAIEFIKKAFQSHYNAGVGSYVTDKAGQALGKQFVSWFKEMEQPGWRPQFLFGSTRLYHDPKLSVVNSIPIDKENPTDFKAVYQRVMVYLDLASHRLNSNPKALEQIKVLQEKLTEISKNTNPTNIEKLQGLITELDTASTQKNSAIKKPLHHILKDPDHLFEMKQIKAEIKKELKETVVIEKAVNTLLKALNNPFFKPKVVSAIKILLNKENLTPDKFKHDLKHILSDGSKNDSPLVKEWSKKVAEYITNGGSLDNLDKVLSDGKAVSKRVKFTKENLKAAQPKEPQVQEKQEHNSNAMKNR